METEPETPSGCMSIFCFGRQVWQIPEAGPSYVSYTPSMPVREFTGSKLILPQYMSSAIFRISSSDDPAGFSLKVGLGPFPWPFLDGESRYASSFATAFLSTPWKQQCGTNTLGGINPTPVYEQHFS